MMRKTTGQLTENRNKEYSIPNDDGMIKIIYGYIAFILHSDI
jgi:hypothetical protein